MFKYLPNNIKILFGSISIKRVYSRRKVVYGEPDLKNIIYVSEKLPKIKFGEVVSVRLSNALSAKTSDEMPRIKFVDNIAKLNIEVPENISVIEVLPQIKIMDKVKITLK